MRTTITINDHVLKLLKERALEDNQTVSALIEQAVSQQLLEDLEDLADAKAREHEPTAQFNDLVTQFRAEGLL